MSPSQSANLEAKQDALGPKSPWPTIKRDFLRLCS